MLHLYLINARVRCFERDTYRNWQQQLVDHFFFECEKKMHLDHGIVSSAIRQRYLKDIFVQWRGLLLAYDEGLIKGDAILASAVWRNLFKGSPDVDPRSLVAIVGWLRGGLAQLEALKDEDVAIRAEEALQSSVSFYWETLEGPFSKVAVGAAEAEEVAEETDAQKKMAAQRRAAAKKVSSS
jgi:cytochrome b pre-mRNA-processing protein 3